MLASPKAWEMGEEIISMVEWSHLNLASCVEATEEGEYKTGHTAHNGPDVVHDDDSSDLSWKPCDVGTIDSAPDSCHNGGGYATLVKTSVMRTVGEKRDGKAP